MKTDTPSLETPQAARLRRRQLIRQLLERDKTPLAILFMAAVVGTLVGLAAVAFDKGVAWLQNQRMGALVHTADNYPLLLTVAFLCSAVLAMFGYFLVRKYAPEAGGSGIPEIEGALEDQRPVRWWRVLPVKFFGGLGTLGGGMVLGREAAAIGVRGRVYDKATIDMQLFIRHAEKKVRRAGGRTRGPEPFKGSDRTRFRHNLIELLRK